MKQTLFLLTTLLAANITNAQLKVKAGTNIASLRGELNGTLNNNITASYDFTETTKSKIGLYAGAGYTFNLTEKLSITPELLYNRLGAKDKEYINNRKTSYTHNYLTLPIFVEYEVVNNLNIGLGPQVNYLLTAKYKSDFKNLPPELQNSVIKEGEETDMHNKLNYGVTAGASYTFIQNLSIEARYYLGLNNLYNQDKLPKFSNATTTTTMKNQAIQIGLSYKFN